MTALTLGEAAAAVLARTATRSVPRATPRAPYRAAHRTGAPVRRDSMEAGTFEDLFFAVPARGEPDRMLRAARAALDAGRRLRRIERAAERVLTAPERAIAGMTAGAVRVFEELCTLARLNAGRVFPSYDRLAEATALGRATVARALGLLEAAGFLVRQRRFKRVEGAGQGERARYAQTSNVYRPMLPARLLDLLPRRLRPAPPPADAVQRVADRAEEVAAMEATLTARELARGLAGGALGRMLARLGAAVDRCESHHGPQPLPDSSIKQSAESALPADTSSLTAFAKTNASTISQPPSPRRTTEASASPPHAP